MIRLGAFRAGEYFAAGHVVALEAQAGRHRQARREVDRGLDERSERIRLVLEDLAVILISVDAFLRAAVAAVAAVEHLSDAAEARAVRQLVTLVANARLDVLPDAGCDRHVGEFDAAFGAEHFVLALTSPHPAALGRAVLPAGEAPAIVIVAVDPRRDRRVVRNIVVVGELQIVVLGVVGVELETFLVEQRGRLGVSVGEEVRGGADEVVLVVVVPLAIVGAGDRQILLRASEAQCAVEVVVAQPLDFPRARRFRAGIGCNDAHVAEVLPRADVTIVADLLVGIVRVAEHALNYGSRGAERIEVLEVDDTVVVERAVGDDRAAQHLDILHAVCRRRVMGRGIEVAREVDRSAVLHDEHLARAAEVRAADADAGMMAETVVGHGNDARHAREGLVVGEGALLLELLRRDARGGSREVLKIAGQEPGGRTHRAEARRVPGGTSVGAACSAPRAGLRKVTLWRRLRRRRGGLRRRALLCNRSGRRFLLLHHLDLRKRTLIGWLRGGLSRRRSRQQANRAGHDRKFEILASQHSIPLP